MRLWRRRLCFSSSPSESRERRGPAPRVESPPSHPAAGGERARRASPALRRPRPRREGPIPEPAARARRGPARAAGQRSADPLRPFSGSGCSRRARSSPPSAALRASGPTLAPATSCWGNWGAQLGPRLRAQTRRSGAANRAAEPQPLETLPGSTRKRKALSFRCAPGRAPEHSRAPGPQQSHKLAPATPATPGWAPASARSERSISQAAARAQPGPGGAVVKRWPGVGK